MMHEIKESDWKIFRQLRSMALERFCRQILSEVKNIDADSARSFHQKYLDIFRLIQRRDKEIAQIFDNPRRSFLPKLGYFQSGNFRVYQIVK